MVSWVAVTEGRTREGSKWCGELDGRDKGGHVTSATTIISHHSPLTYHHSPNTNHQSPITKHQASSIKHQSSIISHQSSVISHQSSRARDFGHCHPPHPSTCLSQPGRFTEQRAGEWAIHLSRGGWQPTVSNPIGIPFGSDRPEPALRWRWHSASASTSSPRGPPPANSRVPPAVKSHATS